MGFDTDAELATLLEKLLNPQLKEISLGLERMHALLEALDNPHQQLPPVIHVAGTNGKGSTIAFMRAVLEAAGKTVHVYTSPHLVSFRERIRVAGELISKQELMPILQRIYDMQEQVPSTFYEATTAAAFVAFSQTAADVVLLETGLGGRLDASNVLAKPMANIITPIGYDHQDYLGNTLAEIAGEKAGILREGVPAFIAHQEGEAMDSIRAHSAEFYVAGENWRYQIEAEQWKFDGWALPLPVLQGEHQMANAALAIACVRHCFPEITQAHAVEAMGSVYWPARLQTLRLPYVPNDIPVYLDGAHNPMAARELVKWARGLPQKPVLIVAMKADKDAEGFIEQWRDAAHFIFLPEIDEIDDYLNANILKKYLIKCDVASEITQGFEEAIKKAIKYQRPVVICGSLYFSGLILESI